MSAAPEYSKYGSRILIGAGLAFADAVFGADAQVDFAKDVWPILEDNCIKCHRAAHLSDGKMKKPKGGVQLDDKAAILRGGEEGKCVVPGNPNKSPMYKLTTLAADHDDDHEHKSREKGKREDD